MKAITITRAFREDAPALSEISLASKKYWGYPDQWIELWHDDLTVTPAMIAQNDTFKLLLEKEAIGYIMLSEQEKGFEIEHCWIKPAYIGKGYGRELLRFVLGQKKFQNQRLSVIADPNALPFYEKFGFRVTDKFPSKPEGRFLPVMERAG